MGTERSGRTPVGLGLTLVLALAVLLAALSYRYRTFLTDDALISLRYSQRLVAGHGLTWNDGEFVEGYSNLLWVLLTAALGALGVDWVRSLLVAGAGCTLASLAALVFVGQPERTRRGLTPTLIAGLLYVVSGPTQIWLHGGLEATLYLATIAWGYALSQRAFVQGDHRAELWAGACCLALTTLTRPDGILFAVVLALLFGITRRMGAALICLAPSAVAYLGQLAFRITTYDAWVPNTTHAKLVFTPSRFAEGFVYLTSGLLWTAPLFAAASVCAILSRSPEGRRRALLWAAPNVAWCAYVVVIGGDIFQGHRHLVVPIGLAALLIAATLPALTTPRSLRTITALGVAGVLSLAAMQPFDPAVAYTTTDRWARDCAEPGQLLRKAFGPLKPLLATEPAGCMPFHSGLPSLDMLGLTDRYLALHPPERMGTGALAHELGDGDYVLSHDPDLVLFCSPWGRELPCMSSGKQMAATPEWTRHYRSIVLQAEGRAKRRTLYWLRWRDGVLGVQQRGTATTIPGYLFTNGADREGEIYALLTDRGLATRLPPHTTAVVAGVPIETGTWTAQGTIDGDAEVQLRRTTHVGTALTLDTAGTVDVLVRTGAREVLVYDVQITPGNLP